MNLKKRHLDLLRKRYRLPISLLTHETPPGSPLREIGYEIEASANAQAKCKLTGLITCSEDAQALINMCAQRGVDKLCVRYADYVSLWSVSVAKETIGNFCNERNEQGASGTMKLVVLKPSVPKEKVRLRAKLDALTTQLLDVLSPAKNGKTHQQKLEGLRFEFGTALETATIRSKSAEMMKNTNLDWLLVLELTSDAPPLAQMEGLWLLKHYYPEEHAYIYLDGNVAAAQLELVRKRIQERVPDREDIPSGFNLHQARQFLLGAVGRYHFEHNLVLVLQEVCKVMDSYLKEEVTELSVSSIINSQIDILQNMMCKRSLIGCQFVDLDDEMEDASENDESEGNAEDSSHEGSVEGDSEYNCKDDKFAEYEDNDYVFVQDGVGNAFVYDDEEDGTSDDSECSVNSPVKAEPVPKEETPISASSFVSTVSEMGDADFSLLIDKYEESMLISMNETIDKDTPENLGKAEEPSLELNETQERAST